MNMQNLMAQAQKMQRDIENKKAELEQMEFTGKSEWVEIKFKGNREVISVNILNDEAFDKENKDMLCDMIQLAIQDGLKQIDTETETKLGSYSQMGGLF